MRLLDGNYSGVGIRDLPQLIAQCASTLAWLTSARELLGLARRPTVVECVPRRRWHYYETSAIAERLEGRNPLLFILGDRK